MEEKIHVLYENIYSMVIGFLYYQSRKNTEEIKTIIPQIQEFVLWFLEGNRYGIDEELYQNLCTNLTWILQDIVTAMTQGDHVLLHDAVAYGLMNYLEMFIPQEEQKNEYL